MQLNVPGGDHDVIAAATLIIVMLTIIIFGGGTVPVLQCMGMIKESKSAPHPAASLAYTIAYCPCAPGPADPV